MKPIGDVLISLGAVDADSDEMVNQLTEIVTSVERDHDYRDAYSRMGLLAAKAIRRCHELEREGSPHVAAAPDDRRRGDSDLARGVRSSPSRP